MCALPEVFPTDFLKIFYFSCTSVNGRLVLFVRFSHNCFLKLVVSTFCPTPTHCFQCHSVQNCYAQDLDERNVF